LRAFAASRPERRSAAAIRRILRALPPLRSCKVRGAGVASVCGVAPRAPIGGCDPPHPASIAAATQLQSAWRLKSKFFMCLAPRFVNATQPSNVSARRCLAPRSGHAMAVKLAQPSGASHSKHGPLSRTSSRGAEAWGVGATPQSRAMPDAIAARARLFTSDLFMPWGRPR
jgi:hypothetical protein